MCVDVCVCVCVCVCRWRITAVEGRGLNRVQGIEIQTEGEGGEGMGKEERGGRGRGLGRDPAPGPRDPVKCSCPRRRPSTQKNSRAHKTTAVLLSVSGPEVLLTERDIADSRRHGAPVRPCKQEACPLEQAPPGR